MSSNPGALQGLKAPRSCSTSAGVVVSWASSLSPDVGRRMSGTGSLSTETDFLLSEMKKLLNASACSKFDVSFLPSWFKAGISFLGEIRRVFISL